MLLSIITLGSCTSLNSNVGVGFKTPNFSLPSDTGSTWDLYKHLARHDCRGVLLVIVPKISTQVCSSQVCGLRNKHSELAKMGVSVVVMNYQSTQELARFRAENGLKHEILLSDASGAICKKFEANNPWVLNAYPKRKSFFIGKNGLIQCVFPDTLTSATPSDEVIRKISGVFA
jgi:peroxiredoxin